MANGASLIMMAFAGTGAIFLGMATLSSIIKRDLSSMGKFLFIGMIMLLVAGIANFFIQSSALMITLAVLAIGIFSAFILYDLKRVKDGEETNYITRDAGRLPEHLQRLPVAAGAVRHRRRQRLIDRACASSRDNGACGPRFRCSAVTAPSAPRSSRARTPPCSRHARCAGTC